MKFLLILIMFWISPAINSQPVDFNDGSIVSSVVHKDNRTIIVNTMVNIYTHQKPKSKVINMFTCMSDEEKQQYLGAEDPSLTLELEHNSEITDVEILPESLDWTKTNRVVLPVQDQGKVF
jgi:hypothetical protein